MARNDLAVETEGGVLPEQTLLRRLGGVLDDEARSTTLTGPRKRLDRSVELSLRRKQSGLGARVIVLTAQEHRETARSARLGETIHVEPLTPCSSRSEVARSSHTDQWVVQKL